LNALLQLGGVERREWERGPSMGHGLQKITRARHGKLPLVINEGRTRPSAPLIAAKFATECNIIVRNHIPVLKHWKEYKKHPALVTQIMGMIQVSTFSNHFHHYFVNIGCCFLQLCWPAPTACCTAAAQGPTASSGKHAHLSSCPLSYLYIYI